MLTEICIAAAVALVATFIAIARLPAELRNVVWGEDGRNFLDDRLRIGGWRSIFEVYEGYLHVVPRLLTDLTVRAFPLDSFAIASTVLSSAVFGIVAALVFVCSRDLVPNRVFRVLLASITVLAPTLPIEVLGNFANLHWSFLWLAPWLFLYRPRTTAGAIGLGIVGILCGLTEIQMLLFAPLALINLRHRRAWLVSIPTIAAVLAQVVTTIVSPRTLNPNVRPGPLDIVVGYGELPVLGAFEGHASRIGATLADGGWAAAAVTVVVAIAVLAFALVPVWTARGVARFVPLILVGGSFIAWAAAIWLNPNLLWQYADFDTAALEGLTATRYVAVPSMLLLGAIVFAASHLYSLGGRRRFISGVAVGLVVMGFLGSFQVDRFSREGGPQWTTSVGEARASCDDGGESVEIRTTPSHWFVTVPCDVLGAR